MNKIKFASIIVVKLLLTYSLVAKSQESSRSHYGEPCSKSLRCESNSMLTCRNGTCDCLKPESMHYDPNIKSCLVLVGEKCRYPIATESSEDNTSRYIWLSQRRNLMEEMDCVPNSWCNHSGICTCAGDYIELGNGTCINTRNFEESCLSSTECRQDRFLSCIEGKCACNDTTSVFNVLLRQCVGKVGYPCLGLDSCVYNGECSVSAGKTHHRRARQSVKVCTCSSGFISDSNGFCRVGLGGKCSESQKCSPDFKCKDGVCACPFENLQVGHVRSQSCLGLVGAPCNSSSFCVANANCAPNNMTGMYECQCNQGFIESTDGNCDLAYGSSCAVVDNELPDDYHPWKRPSMCDRLAPLHCVDNMCTCESDLYSFNGTSCLGKHGAKCERSRLYCIEGAECVDRKGANAMHGRCLCSIEDGYSVSENRTCVK